MSTLALCVACTLCRIIKDRGPTIIQEWGLPNPASGYPGRPHLSTSSAPCETEHFAHESFCMCQGNFEMSVIRTLRIGVLCDMQVSDQYVSGVL